MPTPKEVYQELRILLAALAGLKPRQVTLKSRIREDLGLDSLQSFELFGRLSEKYAPDAKIEDFANAVTVGDVIKRLEC